MIELGNIFRGYMICWRFINVLRLASIWLLFIVLNKLWPYADIQGFTLVFLITMAFFYSIGDNFREERGKQILFDDSKKDLDRVFILFQDFPWLLRMFVKKIARLKRFN